LQELEDFSGQGSADLVSALYAEVMGPAEVSKIKYIVNNFNLFFWYCFMFKRKKN